MRWGEFDLLPWLRVHPRRVGARRRYRTGSADPGALAALTNLEALGVLATSQGLTCARKENRGMLRDISKANTPPQTRAHRVMQNVSGWALG